MNRPKRRIRLGSDRGIVTDKRAHFRRRRDKMDRDAPAHTVAAYRHAIFIDVGLLEQKTPAFGEHAGKFRIRRLGLDLRSGNDVGGLRISQLLEHVDGEGGVTQLRELSCFRFYVFAKTTLGMDQKQRRTGFLPLRIRQKSGYSVLLGAERPLDDSHETLLS